MQNALLTKRSFITALTGLMVVPAFSEVRTQLAFMQAAFDKAQLEGKSILVEIHATWCPTCAIQRQVLAQLSVNPAYENIVVFTIDFDSQKPLVRAMKAQMQSTLVAFKGKQEVARLVGETDTAAIKAMLDKMI